MALLVGKEKSRTMKFDILSPSRTLNLNSKSNQLDIINKNILYLTHEVDKCVSMLRRMEVNANLQKQVDDYFESPDEDTEHIPEEKNGTNHSNKTDIQV